jgi:hypothetical protein
VFLGGRKPTRDASHRYRPESEHRVNGIFRHIRANAVAYLALFVALGGTSYAAANLPANSVGTRQLRNHSVTPIKLNSRYIGAYVRAWAVIQGGTKVIAARPQAHILDWDPADATGDVSWGRAISGTCIPLTSGGGAFVQAAVRQRFRGVPAVVHFGTFDAGGVPDSSSATVTFLAVLCPQR